MTCSLRTCAVAFATIVTASASADVITQWNFESQTTNPSTGSGSASLVGGTSATYATGYAGTGTFAWNVSTFAATGTGNKTRGVQFNAATTGYDSIVLSWNERHSNTSANTVSVQATTDGTNWTEVQVFTFTPAATGTGDTWYSRSVTLSSTYANAAGFGFRVLAAFDPTAGNYVASKAGSAYGTTSTLRFDDVTVNGTLVPSPGAAALVGLAGLMARRRRD